MHVPLGIYSASAPDFLMRTKVLIVSVTSLQVLSGHISQSPHSECPFYSIFFPFFSFFFFFTFFLIIFIFQSEISYLINIICTFLFLCVTMLHIWMYSHICLTLFSLTSNPVFLYPSDVPILIYYIINTVWWDNLIRNTCTCSEVISTNILTVRVSNQTSVGHK